LFPQGDRGFESHPLRHFDIEGKTTFRNCLIGWQMWLNGVYIIDIAGREAGLLPPLVIKLNHD